MASDPQKRFGRKRPFELGALEFSPDVERLLDEGRLLYEPYLTRHTCCDWGDVGYWQWLSNNAALLSGDRLESSYRVHRELAISIVTEADRSATFIRSLSHSVPTGRLIKGERSMFRGFLSRSRYAPPSSPLFALGDLKLSEKVHWLDDKGLIDPLHYLQRHVRADWGELSDIERQANDTALPSNGPLASRYALTPRLAIAIRTNADRSLTLIQLCDEAVSV